MAPVGRAGVVQLHTKYYAVPGNNASLSLFRHRVLVCWWHSIRRRSQKHRINWTRMLTLAKRWLPSTGCAPSFPRCSFCRYSSEIRTGCANERPSALCGGSQRWLSLPRSTTNLERCCSGTFSYTCRRSRHSYEEEWRALKSGNFSGLRFLLLWTKSTSGPSELSKRNRWPGQADEAWDGSPGAAGDETNRRVR